MKLINVDIFLAEARGLCWHEANRIPDAYGVDGIYCKKCQRESPSNLNNPSPTTNWKDYGELLEWAKEQDDWWEEFRNWLWFTELRKLTYDAPKSCSGYGEGVPDCMLSPEIGSRAIAEFLEERK